MDNLPVCRLCGGALITDHGNPYHTVKTKCPLIGVEFTPEQWAALMSQPPAVEAQRREAIIYAHMAGQSDSGVDPSYSNAVVYASCVEAQEQPAPIPTSAYFTSRVADLLHLLQFAAIVCQTDGDREQAFKAMDDIRAYLTRSQNPEADA